jgi:type IV secretion system protein TrbL
VEVGLLTEIMNVFVDAFSGGFDRIRPAISGLLHVLISIEVVWFGVQVLLGVECLSSGIRKVMTIGLWTFVALQFDQHAFALVDSLVQAGMMAAGSEGQSARTLLNPSAILNDGFTAAEPLAVRVLKGTNMFTFLGTYPMFVLTWLLMMLSYGALALSAFMVMIEYYLAIAVVGILLPFGVLGPTRWIATKPASYFLSCGLKMMTIAFLVAISKTVLTRIQFSGEEPTLREMGIAVCCAAMVSMLCWKAPDRLAQGFMHGASSFGGSDVVRPAQAVTSATVRTAATAFGGVGGAMAGAATAAGTAKSKGQSLFTGFKMLQGLGGQGSAGRHGSSSAGGGPSSGLVASASFRPSATPPPVLSPPSDSNKNAAE